MAYRSFRNFSLEYTSLWTQALGTVRKIPILRYPHFLHIAHLLTSELCIFENIDTPLILSHLVMIQLPQIDSPLCHGTWTYTPILLQNCDHWRLCNTLGMDLLLLESMNDVWEGYSFPPLLPSYHSFSQTIFIPSGWWHMVINMDDTVAVTQNFADEANLLQVRRSMLSDPSEITQVLRRHGAT